MAEQAASGQGSLQFIDEQGMFDATGLDAFVEQIELLKCHFSYAVVAIMGPQSSGKSTLLNHLFSTSFREMDALSGRSKTTQGVWVARASGIQPCTIVIDIEGTDGRERGQDDTAFENRSALLAMVLADVVIINMWCSAIGLEQAASRPLLKIVFQVMTMCSESFLTRKITLLFVIRDKTRTRPEVLEQIIKDDVREIWESVPKPQSFEATELSDYFEVRVTFLSNFEEKPEEFKIQVGTLRERIQNCIAPREPMAARVPGTDFVVNTKFLWKTIMQNKYLDYPAHKVMVATVRCDEIADRKLKQFLQNEGWIKVKEGAERGEANRFGNTVTSFLNKCISDYNEEVLHYDEVVRTRKRSALVSQVLATVKPVYQAVLSHCRTGALNKFKQLLKDWAGLPDNREGFATAVRRCTLAAFSDFDEGAADARLKVNAASLDASEPRKELQMDIDEHASEVRTEKIRAIVRRAKERLEKNVEHFTGDILTSAPSQTNKWSNIRESLRSKVDATHLSLWNYLSGYTLEEEEKRTWVPDLYKLGESAVKTAAEEKAKRALSFMQAWFDAHFSESKSTFWRYSHINASARDARSSSLIGLSDLAAIRLDGETTDGIGEALATLLSDSHDPIFYDSSSSWDGMEEDHTLLTPAQCECIWRQFKSWTDSKIQTQRDALPASYFTSERTPPVVRAVAPVVGAVVLYTSIAAVAM